MAEQDLKKYLDTLLRLEDSHKDREFNQSELESIALQAGVSSTVLAEAVERGQRLLKEGWDCFAQSNYKRAEVALTEASELLPWEGRCWLGLAFIQSKQHQKTGFMAPLKRSRQYAEKALTLTLSEEDRRTAQALVSAPRQYRFSIWILPVVVVLAIGFSLFVLWAPQPKESETRPVESVAATPKPSKNNNELEFIKSGDWPSDLILTGVAPLTRYKDSWSVQVSYSLVSQHSALGKLDLEIEILNNLGLPLQLRKIEHIYSTQPPILPGETLAGGILFYQELSDRSEAEMPESVQVRIVGIDGFSSGPEAKNYGEASFESSQPLPQDVALSFHWRETSPVAELSDQFFYTGLLLVKNTGSRPLTKLKLQLTYLNETTGQVFNKDLWAVSRDQPPFVPNEIRPLFFSKSLPLILKADFEGGRIPLSIHILEIN